MAPVPSGGCFPSEVGLDDFVDGRDVGGGSWRRRERGRRLSNGVGVASSLRSFDGGVG